MSRVKGAPQLHKRFEAIGNGRTMLQTVQLRAVAEGKRLHAPNRKTGHTSRTIMPGPVSDTVAVIQASGAAVWLERGTRRHVIRPRNGSTLAWPANASGRRLSGRARTNSGRMIFAAVVNHPGSKPYPFLLPGAVKAVRDLGVSPLVKAWNDAA
jgi:hypothetical protein